VVIRVTIELIPGGEEREKKTLEVVEITNDETGTERIGNYLVSDGTRVELHTRTRSVRDLVIKALGGKLHG
jgi:hypothetical protein